MTSTRPDIQVRKFASNRAADAADKKATPPAPAAGIVLVWDLTVAARALKGKDVAADRLPRHIIHIQRRER